MGTEEQSDPTQPETNDPDSGSSRWNPHANSDQAESQTDYARKQHKSFLGKSAELLKEPKTWLEIAALVVVILYTGYARKQSMAMNKTLDEIRKQTNYAKSSSMAATDAAKDATASVKIARETLKAGNESFDKTMGEMKAQTRAIQVMAQFENRSAAVSAEILTTTIRSFRDEQRPWVGMGEIQSQIDAKEPFKLNIPFVNSGKTPAIHTEVAVSFNIYYAYQSGPRRIRLTISSQRRPYRRKGNTSSM